MAGLDQTIGVAIKGAKKVDRWIKSEKERTEKAMNTAIKVEGFRLKNLLQKEIRQGAPGGRPFKPLSFIARRAEKQVKTGGGKTRRQSPNRKALARMAFGVRYQIQKAFPFQMAIGFVNPTTGGQKTSSTWRRRAKMHQEGFTSPVTVAQRRFFAYRGAQLGVAEDEDTPFFLRRTTRRFKTPARPMVDPFWTAHRRKARKNIDKNFSKKLKGHRI